MANGPQIISKETAQPGAQLFSLTSQNPLLTRLLASSADYLIPELSVEKLSFNDMLYEHGDTIDFVYFPIDSTVSSLAIMEDGTTIEILMIGREGLVGMSSILGAGEARHWTRACIGGFVVKLSVKALDHVFLNNEAALKALLRAYLSLVTQVSQRAVCNARHTILERLCCWLLMTHDRVGGENLRLTQEAIASRVGARRAGITVAAGLLQSANAIEYRRGQMHIASREILEAQVCECYPLLKAEFDGLKPLKVTHLK